MAETGGIGNLSGLVNALGLDRAEAAGKTVPKAMTGTSGALGADQATLSSVGGALLQALSADDVRTDRVASLQASIASGNYQVPAEAVADKMMESMLQ